MTRGEFIELVSSVLTQGSNINKHLWNGVSVLQKGVTVQDKKLDSKQWNELLVSAIAYNLGDIALRVFNRMNELKVPSASHISVKLVSHLAERHRMEDAQKVLATLATQSTPLTVHHYLALLRCSGSFSVAQNVLFQMECARFDINVMTYSTAIKSCESTSDVTAALQLLDQMKAMGIPPNEITYCCAISVASKSLRCERRRTNTGNSVRGHRLTTSAQRHTSRSKSRRGSYSAVAATRKTV
jgi:pentatricopeptide repeat protein